MKKWFVCLLTVMLVLGNCTMGVAQEDWFPTENIHLRWSFWASAEEMQYWSDRINSYMELHPNVTIEMETTTWNQYWEKLTTQVASNSVPDILGMTSGYAREYMVNGALLDMKPYMDRDSAIEGSGWVTDDYYEGVFWSYEYNDGVYAVPYDMGPAAVLMNVDLFNEFGVELPKDGWTFDEMIEIARKLTVDRDGDGITDVYGCAATGKDSTFYDTFVLSLGSKMAIENEDGSWTFEFSEMTAPYLQKFADGLREGWNYDSQEAQDLGLFASGNIAMIFANPEWMGKYAKLMENPNLYVLEAPMTGDPKYDTGSKYIGGGGFSISADTPYPEVCWDFIKYYLGYDGIKKCTAEPFRGIPPLRTLADDFVNSEFAPQNAVALLNFVEKDTADNVFFNCPNWNRIQSIMNSELEAVYSGTKTAEEACSYIVEQGNTLANSEE